MFDMLQRRKEFITFSKSVSLITCTDHCSNVFQLKGKHTILGNPVAIDADGLLMDVDVQSINDSPPTREDKWQDIDNFFGTAIVKDVNGKSKEYCTCKLCL